MCICIYGVSHSYIATVHVYLCACVLVYMGTCVHVYLCAYICVYYMHGVSAYL